MSDWNARLAQEVAEKTAEAQALVGKTISTAVVRPSYHDCDDVSTLHLTFSDGTSVDIQGGYTGYTGASRDEYQEYITVGVVEV